VTRLILTTTTNSLVDNTTNSTNKFFSSGDYRFEVLHDNQKLFVEGKLF
jgi:hypothetical protein